MRPDLHFVTLSTSDLDAARRFYVDGLDWTPLADVAGEVLFFQTAPGLVLGFFASEKFAEDVGAPEPQVVSGVTLSHNVPSREEVTATVDRLESAGGEVVTSPRDGAFGGIFHALVRDPNGVLWEIAHNPGWAIGPDGRVTFG